MAVTGILAIWHDITPEHVEDTLAWYDREHHFERLAVPGFRSVRRYEAERGEPRLFIRYETDDAGVLGSPAYLDRLNNPTPWTLRCQPQFRNSSRTVCYREARSGAEGGYAATFRIDSADLVDTTDWSAAAAAVAASPGVVGWELWRADIDRSSIQTREKQLRGGEDRYVAAVAVLHATSHAAAAAALDVLPLPAGAELRAGVYRLMFSASNPNS